MARSKYRKRDFGEYNVIIEIDYYGDELNATFHDTRTGYFRGVYPLDEVRDLVERLRSGGATVIDKTVYSQNERMTYEEYIAEYGEEPPDYLRF